MTCSGMSHLRLCAPLVCMCVFVRHCVCLLFDLVGARAYCRLSIYLSVCLSYCIYLSVCLSACLSIYLRIYLYNALLLLLLPGLLHRLCVLARERRAKLGIIIRTHWSACLTRSREFVCSRCRVDGANDGVGKHGLR